jgi:hypothetical protein
MGISAQRLHRRKLAEAQGRPATPAAPALPALIPREQHQRALQELTRSYERKLGAAGLTPGEREELEQLRRDIEAAKTEWQPMLDELERVRTELEQAQAHIRDLEATSGSGDLEGAEGGTAGGEQPAGDGAASAPAETPAVETPASDGTAAVEQEPKPEEPKGKGGKKGK